MHLTTVRSGFGYTCMYSPPKEIVRTEEDVEEKTGIKIDGEPNRKQVSETMTEMTGKQAGRHRHRQPFDSAWLMYLCVCASVYCIYANASGEIILCGLVVPTQCGNIAQLSQVQIPRDKDR